MAKVGDTVRFLNAVGGGRIVRIEGQVAYVDEDGFETPALLRECVVVATGDTFYQSETRKKKAEAAEKQSEPEMKKPQPALPPVVETPEGEKINIVLGFEPENIKKLSTTSFDAFLVNDSNYSLYVVIATRDDVSDKWALRFDGYIEPAVQEFVFELTTADLPSINRISIQAVPFKRTGDFGLKPSISFEQRLDATKFARLHCFVQNPYFDSPVLALDVVKDDKVKAPVKVDAAEIEKAMSRKRIADSKPHADKKISKPAQRPDVVEVDLHASSLLDNLNGLSKADILNYQIDTFRKVMDENLAFPGRKIIFIHGKGEGVLRQSLMKELNYRYKGHDVADASFREYGFGATQVTIRHINRK